jgi:hypothetical protein
MPLGEEEFAIVLHGRLVEVDVQLVVDLDEERLR